MSLTCSILYLIFVFNIKKFKSDKYLYLMISISIFILFFSIPFASAAAERFSLYFIPIQIVALTRILYIINDSLLKFIFLNLIVIGYFCVFIVWFIFHIISICMCLTNLWQYFRNNYINILCLKMIITLA